MRPDGYQSVETAPEDKMLSVSWTSGDGKHSYGVAKRAHGKWWDYTSANPHARGRECATPSGWHSEYKL